MTDTTIETPVPTVRADQGEARWWWGNLAVLKVTGEHTRGGLTVVEVTMGPGAEWRRCTCTTARRKLPRHRWTSHLPDRRPDDRGGPRDLVIGPRDVPHRFTAGPDGATVLFLLTRAGLEGLILEQSVPATSRELPPPAAVPPPDLNRMREIALRYGCELLA